MATMPAFGVGPLHWTSTDDGLVISDWLGRSVTLDDFGVSSRGVVWRRRWPWTEVSAMSWDAGWRSSFGLAACVRGDPYIKRLAVKWGTAELVQSALEEAR